MCGAPPAAALATVRAAQQTRTAGGTSSATRSGTDIDLDTTALAVEALVAGGADATDAAVKAALGFFAANQQASGAWQSFGSDDPNSTALAILGITAAGYDADSPCWRDTADPSMAGTAYANPSTWLASQQSQPAGRCRPHREPQRPVRREHVRHVADGRGSAPVVAADRRAPRHRRVSMPVTPVDARGTDRRGPAVAAAALAAAPRFTG